MVLFRNFGVNHAKDETGLAKSLVRRTEVSLRAMPQISVNLQKIANFWIGNFPVPFMKPRMSTIYFFSTGKVMVAPYQPTMETIGKRARTRSR